MKIYESMVICRSSVRSLGHRCTKKQTGDIMSYLLHSPPPPESFNKYVQLTGCTKYKRPATVSDDTPLLHLLSYSVDGEQGSDLLYTVILDIVSVWCYRALHGRGG